MKKSIKILLITLATIAVLVLATALLISPIAKRYIVEHSKELTGRQINIDELRFNIFTGRLHIENICMLESDDTTNFAAIGTYDMKMRLLPLLSRHVAIEQITIDRPDVKIYQTGAHFNFDDLLVRFLADTTTVEEPSEPWEVG
ncbi:MAG: AsmA family protein, partial [Alistipes sp.]